MEETVVKAVKLMCDRLANYHWSPEPPHSYPRIGKIAYKDIGAFNLAWGYCNGKVFDESDQVKMIMHFSQFQVYTSYKVNDVPLGDWACLLKPKAFNVLLTGLDMPLDIGHSVKLATLRALDMEKS